MEPVQSAYGLMAEQYIELVTSAETHPEDLSLIGRHLSTRPGAVLDVGCGPGHLTAHLRSLGVDAVGLDMVREFIDHARATYPGGRYGLGSMRGLPVRDAAVGGILAWYSLIHLPPDDLDGVLAELRRVVAAAGRLVVGFFDGDELEAFDHKVITAWYWPVDAFAERLSRAGFTVVERLGRPGVDVAGRRAHAAMAATAG